MKEVPLQREGLVLERVEVGDRAAQREELGAQQLQVLLQRTEVRESLVVRTLALRERALQRLARGT